MAYHSIYGRHVGTDPADSNKLVLLGGLKTPALSVGAAGSEVVVGGTAGAVVESTASTISAGGLSLFASTATGSYTLAAPVPNMEKTLFQTVSSTLARTITIASGQIQSTAQSTLATITLNGAGQCLTLIGLSTAKWGVKANMGATLA